MMLREQQQQKDHGKNQATVQWINGYFLKVLLFS